MPEIWPFMAIFGTFLAYIGPQKVVKLSEK